MLNTLNELSIILKVRIFPLNTVPVPVIILITSLAMSVPVTPGSTPKRPTSDGLGFRIADLPGVSSG